MPLYTYKAIDAAGKSVMGRVDAGNVFDLEQRLSRMGLDLVSGAPSSTKSRLLAGARVPRPDLINFCFHLEQLAGAGVPIVEGLIDLRERPERERSGVIPGSLHAPYAELATHVRPGGMLHELALATGKRLLFYCAFGERSAMAVQAAQDAGIITSCHIHGGIYAWRKAQGPLVR